MVTCEFCGYTDSLNSDAFQVDNMEQGFWCEDCDGYNYLDSKIDRHQFTLILEDKKANQETTIKAKAKLNKRISPYRYPGGKTKLIEYLYTHLQESKSKKLISPFTGGGSFELAMLDAGIVEELHLNDLDTGGFSLWWVIKHMPYVLIERLKNEEPNHKDYFFAQSIIKSDYKNVDLVDAAWYSLLVNRLAYSGIVKANPMGGKKGSKEKLLARWNPQDLVRRIERIHELSDRIEITQTDALELIEESYWEDKSTIFIDPPYVEKGKDLYHCFYTKRNHQELSILLDSLYQGFSGADIVVTYDFNEWLSDLYTFPNKQIVGRKYSA